MRHKKFEALLQFSFYGELSDEERSALTSHLRECAQCQAEREELSRFHSMISEKGVLNPIEINDADLDDARRRLHARLMHQNEKNSFRNSLNRRMEAFIAPSYRIVLGSLVVLFVGIGAGYVLFSPSVEMKNHESIKTMGNASFEQGETHSTNLRFLNSDDKKGDIDFVFDAVTPVHIKGKLGDERVQQILAKALVNDDNPGVRIRSASVLATNAEGSQQTDPVVKRALITALESDGNAGVRREALKALTQFPFDDIKNGMLYALLHDTNAGIRIAAINGLELTKYESRMQDSEIVNVLKEKMHSDDNNYIRFQARNILEEVINK
jgi:HEAT repeats/Putative zinc-finger